MGERRVATLENLSEGLAGGKECIFWRFYIKPDGYAQVSYNGDSINAHRAIWFMASRELPKGFSIDHICHNPHYCNGGTQCQHRRCINIDHLRLATPREQLLNSVKSRSARFCKNGHLWTEEGTYVRPDGKVECRTCRRNRDKYIYEKKMGRVV